MSYELSYAEKGFLVHFAGNVSIEELNRANGEIQTHYYFDYHTYQVIDLLDANLSSVTEEDAEFPAVTDSVASKTTLHSVRVVFVVKESYAFSVVNSYVTYARQLVPKWEFAVFPTRDEALKWARSARLSA
nr:hypothetical protein [uncultured Desulfobulbus sp.]